jgi:hypothetical protein
MGAAAIAAVLGARAGGPLMIGLAAAMLGGLFAAWIWVRRIEARQIVAARQIEEKA